MKKKLYLFLVVLRNGFNENKTEIVFLSHSYILNFLSLLKRERIIIKYTLFNKKNLKSSYVKIFLKNDIHIEELFPLPNKDKPFSFMTIDSTPTNKTILSYSKKPELFDNLNTIKILLTDSGLITCSQAKKLRIGGTLLCTFYL